MRRNDALQPFQGNVGVRLRASARKFLKALQAIFARRTLLISDEISMVGAQKFAAMSLREGEARENDTPFGNIGVILLLDFVQIQPVGQKALIAPISSESSMVSAKLGVAVRRIFDTFRDFVKSRVIYRTGAPCPFKESTRRQIDCAVTLEDY